MTWSTSGTSAIRTKETFFTSSIITILEVPIDDSKWFWFSTTHAMFGCETHYNHGQPKKNEFAVSHCTAAPYAFAARRYHPRTMLFGRHRQPRTPHGTHRDHEPPHEPAVSLRIVHVQQSIRSTDHFGVGVRFFQKNATHRFLNSYTVPGSHVGFSYDLSHPNLQRAGNESPVT